MPRSEAGKKARRACVDRIHAENRKINANRILSGFETCTKCHISKPVNEFYKDPQTKRGLRYACKYCDNLWYKCTDYRKYDKKHGMETATIEELVTALKGQKCTYCDSYKMVGADRIDNNKGHAIENIVPCCYRCNIVRGDSFSFEEMRDFIAPAILAVEDSRNIAVKQSK